MWTDLAGALPSLQWLSEETSERESRETCSAVGTGAGRVMEQIREVLTAILQSTREDEQGEQWTIRAYLDKHGLFNGDISSSRRLVATACQHALTVLQKAAPNAKQRKRARYLKKRAERRRLKRET